MWFSWHEAKKVHRDDLQDTNVSKEAASSTKSFFGKTLAFLHPRLNVPEIVGVSSQRHPPSDVVFELWRSFLTNVHPLVKIFLHWQKEPVVRLAAEEPDTLSREQEALMFSIYFITILSLTEDRCLQILSMPRSEALEHYQSLTELALLHAGFIDSSDRSVMQAFLLYLVSDQLFSP